MLALSLQPNFNATVTGANSATFPRPGTADPVLAAGDSYWFRCRPALQLAACLAVNNAYQRYFWPLPAQCSLTCIVYNVEKLFRRLASVACRLWMFCCRVAGVNADGKLGPWSGFNTKALTVSQVTDTLVVTQNRCASHQGPPVPLAVSLTTS